MLRAFTSFISSAASSAIAAPKDKDSGQTYEDTASTQGAHNSTSSQLHDHENDQTSITTSAQLSVSGGVSSTKRKDLAAALPRPSKRLHSITVVDETTGDVMSMRNASLSVFIAQYVQNVRRAHHMADDVHDALITAASYNDWIVRLRADESISLNAREKLIRAVSSHRSRFYYRMGTEIVLGEHKPVLERCDRKKHPIFIEVCDSDYAIVVKVSDCINRIQAAHTETRHQGQDNTWEILTDPPNGGRRFDCVVRDWVREYVNRCKICQSKAAKVSNRDALTPIVSEDIMERVQIDAIDYRHMPYDGKKWVFNVVDHFSKFHWVVCTPSKESHHAVTLLRHIFTSHGQPKILHSDNGKEFVNKSMKDLLNDYKVREVHGMPYKPRVQGVIERANGSLKTLIHKWMAERKSHDWVTAAFKCTATLNITRGRTTGFTPYELMFGRPPQHTVARWTASFDKAANEEKSRKPESDEQDVKFEPDAEICDDEVPEISDENTVSTVGSQSKKLTALQRGRLSATSLNTTNTKRAWSTIGQSRQLCKRPRR